MPFKFKWLCDLLDKLEEPHLPPTPAPKLLPKALEEYKKKLILQWFKNNIDRLNEYATQDDAVKCMLRPAESWVDRQYFGVEEELEPLLSQVLELTDTEVVELYKWKTHPYTANMGAQVARIWASKKGPNQMVHRDDEVTVEQIDQFFIKTAADNPRSSLELQSLQRYSPHHVVTVELKDIFSRLWPREAKWMTRLLLKTTEPAKVPASFFANSGSLKLPQCLPAFLNLSCPAPTTLMCGKTKMIKAKKPVVPSPTPRLANTITPRRPPTPERHGSPETDLRPRERGRRNSRGLKSLNRSVSRPRTTKVKGNGHELPESIPTPPSSSPMSLPPALKTSENSDPQPAAKRRRISKESSPGTYVFKRGILGPIRETNISNNHSLSKNLVNAKVPRDSLSQEKNPQNHPSFPLANSSQPRMPPGSKSADTLRPAQEKAPNDSHEHRTRSKVVSPTVILEDDMQSNETLPTPASSDPASQSPQGKMNSDADTAEPSRLDAGIQVQLEDVPRLSIENPQDPSLVVPSPLPKWLPLSTTIPNSPMIIGGAGRCTISADPNAKRCPLTDCIFLPSPYLPAHVIDSLKTSLFAHHGSRYITSVKDLGGPSLPHRCQATNTNYRKVVLIEPSDIDEMAQVRREVQDLDLKRRNGRKYWTAFYDWRLLGDIGSNEWGEEVEGNSWERCFWALE